MTTIFMEGGPRRGAGLMIEPQIKAQIEAGNTVVVHRRGVYFSTSIRGDGISYCALPRRPDDAPEFAVPEA